MQAWLLDIVACPGPGCGGRLAARPGGDLLVCRRCGALYPVLGGVPVLVPDPADWAASHRDAILASLAEAGQATRRALAVLDAFSQARGGPPPEPVRFGDDWTDDEPGQEPVPLDPALAAYVAQAGSRGPLPTLLGMLPTHVGTLLDVGTGDGALAAAMRPRCDQLLVGDLSLRAVLRATARARRGRGAVLAPVVMDAEHLPVRRRALDVLTAANLVDLLSNPDAFLDSARASLKTKGWLLLSVPDPTGLDGRLGRAGFSIAREVPVAPWLRQHHERHVQIYLPRVLAARAR